MNFRQFYRCMCRNRSGIAPGRLFRGLQSFANPNCRLELRTGEMPAYCLPVTAKAGPRLSARSFSGNDRILGLLRFLLKDGEGIIV